MHTLRTLLEQARFALHAWALPRRAQLTAASLTLVRLSLGIVFLLFGLLKFVPGLSPAADIATRTMMTLTFGLVPPELALLLVAALETAIGISLLSRRWTGAGIGLLGVALVGILSPLVLFPEALFSGPFFAPTLMGQYVIKDIVLVAAASVLAVQTVAGPAASQPTHRHRLPARLPARSSWPSAQSAGD